MAWLPFQKDTNDKKNTDVTVLHFKQTQKQTKIATYA